MSSLTTAPTTTSVVDHAWARRASTAVVGTGLLSIAAAAFLVFTPASVPTGKWNYPLTESDFTVAQIIFCLLHALAAFGLYALIRSGVAGAGTAARRRGFAAVAAWVALGGWELVAITAAGHAQADSSTAWIGAGYGVIQLAIGITLILLGRQVRAAGVITGPGRSAVLVNGIFGIVPMLAVPAVGFVGGRTLIALAAALFIWMGVVVGRAEEGRPVGN